MPQELGNLPPSMLGRILGFDKPEEMDTIPHHSKAFRWILADETAIYKQRYELCLDMPLIEKEDDKEYDWEQALKAIARFKIMCLRGTISTSDIPFAYKIFNHMVLNAATSKQSFTDITRVTMCKSHWNQRYDGLPEAWWDNMMAIHYKGPLSRNIAILKKIFESSSVQSILLWQSSNSRRVLALRSGRERDDFGELLPEKERQMSAHMHCLFGPILGSVFKDGAYQEDGYRWWPRVAAATLYDLRNHNERTGWGPFHNDGSFRVNWETVEAIMALMAPKIKNEAWKDSRVQRDARLLHFTTVPFAGTWPTSWTGLHPLHPLQSYMAEPLDRYDPYGINGRWRQLSCSLPKPDRDDFNDKIRALPPDRLHYPALSRQRLGARDMTFDVTKLTAPGVMDDPRLPVAHFDGYSNELCLKLTVAGTVRMTRHGDIRWTFHYTHGNRLEFHVECVQVGGLRSAKGLVGLWSRKYAGAGVVVGPTVLWKLSDMIRERKVVVERGVRKLLKAHNLPYKMETFDEDDELANTLFVI